MRIFGKGILNFGKAHWKAIIAVIWMVFATNKLIQSESEVSSIRREVSSIGSEVRSIESEVSSVYLEVLAIQ